MKKQILSLLCIGLLSWSCAEMDKDPYEIDSNSLRIGVITNFTGSLASFGRSIYFATQLAAQEINAAGGVNGQKLQLIPKDDKLDKAVAQEAAQELLDDGVVGIIGSLASSMTLAIAENVTIAAKIPLISSSSTSPKITDLNDDGSVWRTISSDAFQGQFLAGKVWARGIKKASIIYVDNAYGQGLANRFDEVFTELGGTITAKAGYTEGKTKDFGTQVTQILQGLTDGDAVAIFGYETDSAAITTEIAAHSRPDLSYWGCDGNYSLSFLKNANINVVRKMQGSTPQPSSGETYTRFAKAFEDEVHEAPTQYTENAYDALYLMALAMIKAGNNTAQTILANLATVSTNDGDDTTIDPATFIEARTVFEAGGDIDFRGASGEVDFTAAGDVSSNYLLWQVTADGSSFEIAND